MLNMALDEKVHYLKGSIISFLKKIYFKWQVVQLSKSMNNMQILRPPHLHIKHCNGPLRT